MSYDTQPLRNLSENCSRRFFFRKDKPVVFVNTGDVLDGKFLHKNLSHSDGLPGQAKKAIKAGDILFTEIRPANKRFLLVSGGVEDYVVSTKFMVIRPTKLLTSEFLYLYLTAPSTLKELQHLAEHRSGTFPQITFDSISHLLVPTPPPEKQKEIVSLFAYLQNSVETLKNQNTVLESIAHRLFRSWFVNFDPVHARAAGNAPEAMSAELAELFPSEFEESPLGLIPKGWSWQGVDHSITYLNGLALQKYPVVEGEPTLPILKISQLRAGRTDPKVLSNRKMKSEFIVKDGDIIFSWSGSLEVRIWTGGDAALNQHLFKVFSEKHPAWFCYQATQHHLPSFRETAASKATTMGHIQRRHLSEAKVAVCPPSLMAKLNDIFVPMQKTVVLNGQLIREIEQLRDHLLPRLISGKLSIGEAEKAVAELLPEPVEAI